MEPTRARTRFPFAASDAARGAIIALIALLLARLPQVPNAPIASPTLLLILGLALQVLGLAARFALRWLERNRDLDGLLPVAAHVGAIARDGLTVLLVALALFQGITARIAAV